MRIKYEDEAKADLVEIRQHYLDAGGKALALRMVRGIRAEITAIADNPNSAPAYELVQDLRRLVVAKGAFLVFYRVTTRIEVVHVRRAERKQLTSDRNFEEE